MVGIVIIGDEILSASVREVNLHVMLTTLGEMGYQVGEVRIVRDDIEEIARAIREVHARSELVITAGGIGPTHDDVTLAGVAAAFQTPVNEQPAMRTFLEQRHGTPLSAMVARMASMPEGTEIIGAEGGHWPVIRWSNVYILPGLPRALVDKMQRMREILPVRQPTIQQALYLNVDESEFADWLDAIVSDLGDVTVGSYPVVGDYDYRARVVVRGADRATVEVAVARLASYVTDAGWLVRRSEP